MRNLKRALSLALALVMVLSMMVVGAGAVSIDDFTDADEIVNTEAVTTMVSLGVIDGNDDGSYNPSGIVKRGEMAKLIAVMLNGGSDPTLGETPVVFADTAGHWAQNYISYVANLHIIDGRGDGTFGPNDDVTGSEAAKMLLTALGYRSDLEGFTGANWAINVQAMANQVELFEGLTINPDEGLSRDNTAQMLYNAVQADMVEYRNLEGSYDGIVYPQPINGVNNDSTVLYERFHVRKVTGILEANDKVSVAGFIAANSTGINQGGHDFGDVALDGQSLLYVTDVSGYTYDRTWNVSTSYINNLYGPATYKVDTSDDMVGQEIVIYVRYENDLSPNAANATVIGTPILTENNTVVETNGRLEDAAAVRAALRAGGLTNIGNEVHSVLYTEVDVDDGVNTGITDEITTRIRTNLETPEVTRSAGIQQRFIDNDGNGYPDYIIQVAPVLSSVNSVNSDASKYTFTGITGTIDSADVVTEEELARNDVVLINKYADDRYYISYPDTVEGVIESYNSNNNTISVDGTSYANSGGVNRAVTTGQEQILNEDMVDGSYIFYLDPYGNVLGALETEGVVGNYAVVQGWSRSGNLTMGYSVSVKLLMQDGSTGTYNLNLAATAVRLGMADSTDSTREKENAITITDGVNNGADYFGDPSTLDDVDPTNDEGTEVLNHLFSYTLDGDTVTLARAYHVNEARYASARTGSNQDDLTFTAPATEVVLRNNLASYATNLMGENDDEVLTSINNVVLNDQTVFFFKDEADNYYVITGLANLPSNTSSRNLAAYRNDTVGIPVADSDVIAYRAPGSSSWIARAVFVDTDNYMESVRDYVFVTDKWVTRNESGSPIYTFTVVNVNGETSQMTTTQSANNLKNTVREWSNDGSYVEFFSGDRNTMADDGFTWHNVYVSEIDGNVITLSDVDTDTVRGSYRVDGGADIWDVQDDQPVGDTLQVNDIVGVYLDDEDIVVAAFIYDVMNGAYPARPSALNLNGVSMLGGGTLTLDALANTTVPVSITLSQDVNIDALTAAFMRDTDGDGVKETQVDLLSISNMRDADSDNTWEGSFQIPGTVRAGDDLVLTLTITQDGMDDLTIEYAPVTLAVTSSDAPSAVTVNAPESFDGTVENTLTVDVTGGESLGYTWTVTTGETLVATIDGVTPVTGYTLNEDGSLTVAADTLANGSGSYTFTCAVVSNAGQENESTPKTGSATVTPAVPPVTKRVVFADTISAGFRFYAIGENGYGVDTEITPTNDPGTMSSVTVPAGQGLAIEGTGSNVFTPYSKYTLGGVEFSVDSVGLLIMPYEHITDGMTFDYSASNVVDGVWDSPDADTVSDILDSQGNATITGTVPPVIGATDQPNIDTLTLRDAEIVENTLIGGEASIDGTVTVRENVELEATLLNIESSGTLVLEPGFGLGISALNVRMGGTIRLDNADGQGNAIVVTAYQDLYFDFVSNQITDASGTQTSFAVEGVGGLLNAIGTAAGIDGYFKAPASAEEPTP